MAPAPAPEWFQSPIALQPDTDGGAGDAGERDGGEGDSGGVAPDATGADSMAMDAPAGDAARADASNRDTPPNREDDGGCICSTMRTSSHRGTAAFVCIALLSIARLRR